MIVVELPFPPKELSPNSRLHWAVVSKAKKSYRSRAQLTTQFVANNWQLGGWKPTGKIKISYTFYPSANRHYDFDNLISRMKAGMDGIADALGINDKNFRLGTVDIAPAIKGGMVRVRIEELV